MLSQTITEDPFRTGCGRLFQVWLLREDAGASACSPSDGEVTGETHTANLLLDDLVAAVPALAQQSQCLRPPARTATPLRRRVARARTPMARAIELPEANPTPGAPLKMTFRCKERTTPKL